MLTDVIFTSEEEERSPKYGHIATTKAFLRTYSKGLKSMSTTWKVYFKNILLRLVGPKKN